MSGESETLDIEAVIARWDEIMDRTEAGEPFAISVKCEPKAKAMGLITLLVPKSRFGLAVLDSITSLHPGRVADAGRAGAGIAAADTTRVGHLHAACPGGGVA